jgi:BirA family biotin operon repressor/biotin-[acetyl-CoA-carboxylase] ligase
MRERYRQRLYRRQGLFSYRDKEGVFLAEQITVSDDGTLLLLDESGKRRSYRFKEVTFIQHNEKSK